MKLLYVASLYYPVVGGAEKIAQNLAEGMAAKGHQVSVATLCRKGNARTERLNGVKIRYIPIRNIYLHFVKAQPLLAQIVWHLIDTFNPLAARDVARIVEEEAPDLVHTHNVAGFSAEVWPQVRSRRLPCVHTMHDYYLL